MNPENQISFGNINNYFLNRLFQNDWEENSEKSVEYFQNNFTTVKLVSFNDPLDDELNWIDDGYPLAFDHQWGNKSKNQNENYISLFQFCSSNGILLIKRDQETKSINRKLLDFMINHDFFVKVSKNDYLKLKQALGPEASQIKFEDITRTRLLPNERSISFDQMVESYCDETPLYTFNVISKRIQILSWDFCPLKQVQVLFAGYKVLALYKSMQNLPNPDMHFISDNLNVPIPIQHINGISRFHVHPNLKYMLVYGNDNFGSLDLINNVGLKQTFRNIFFFTKDGETNDNNSPFDKAIIEVENLIQFKKKVQKIDLKIASIDSSLWAIEDNPP